jgi:hypothetical protein
MASVEPKVFLKWLNDSYAEALCNPQSEVASAFRRYESRRRHYKKHSEHWHTKEWTQVMSLLFARIARGHRYIQEWEREGPAWDRGTPPKSPIDLTWYGAGSSSACVLIELENSSDRGIRTELRKLASRQGCLRVLVTYPWRTKNADLRLSDYENLRRRTGRFTKGLRGVKGTMLILGDSNWNRRSGWKGYVHDGQTFVDLSTLSS